MLSNPANRHRAVTLTFDQFRYGFANAVSEDVVLTYSTADGGAMVSDGDYVGITNATLTIPAGQTSGTISVTVNGDTKFEGDEQFYVNITQAPINVILDDYQGLGTIQNVTVTDNQS